MSSNPINVKINNFDMMNGMNATFNINGKDFDIMISPDDINKYFTSNTNIPIAKIIPNDESDNEVKGTIADDGNKKRTGFMSSVFGKFKNVSKLHPEDENAIDNAAEKIFEKNRQDGNEILTGLMSTILEELNKEELNDTDKETIRNFMSQPKHFRHEGGGGVIKWVDYNNDNDNVNELINGSFEKSLLGIDTSKIKVLKTPEDINSNPDKMKKWKFSQFLINAAFIQKYHKNNENNKIFDTYKTDLKAWKRAEYDNLKPNDETSVSYIFSALSRVLCYDDSLNTIESLSKIVSYTGDITQYENRYKFQEGQVDEYNNLVANFNNDIIEQDTNRNKTLITNKDDCPTEKPLAIDLGSVNLNNPDDIVNVDNNNDGNNANNADNDDNDDVDWWNKRDELQEDEKSTLPIQNIRTIIKDSGNKDLKKDFKVLYTQYIAIRTALKTVDRGINTIRDELPGMKNIIETESQPGARDNNRLTNMKNDLKNRLNTEKSNIDEQVSILNEVIENLEKHHNYKVIDRSIIDKIRNYKDTYTVALYQLYKKFTSIAKSNLSWSDSISNVFSRKKSGEESINNNNNNSNTGKLSGFMSAIGNVFNPRNAAGDGPSANGGKKNRTKRLKEPRNRSLKKGNH